MVPCGPPAAVSRVVPCGPPAAVSRVVPCGPPEGELVQPALELEFHVLEYVSELVKEVGVAPEVLDKRCSDDHLRSISLFLDWRTVAPHLGLSETDQEEIESDGKKDPAKRLKTLV